MARIRGRHWLLALVSAWVLLAGCARERAIDAAACSGSPGGEAAALRSRCGENLECWRLERNERQTEVDRHPRDLAAHEALVRSSLLYPGAEGLDLRDELRRRYDELAESHPRDPAPLYLGALLRFNAEGAPELAERALELDPTFSRAHAAAALALLGRQGAAREPERARAHVEAFSQACPERAEDRVRLLAVLDDGELFAREAPDLESRIAPEADRFRGISGLWELELGFASPDERESRRARAETELAELRALEIGADRAWLSEVNDLALAVGDAATEKWVDDAWIAAWPCSSEAVLLRLRRLRESARGLETVSTPESPGSVAESDDLSGLRSLTEECKDSEDAWNGLLVELLRAGPSASEELSRVAERLEQVAGPRFLEQLGKALIRKGVEVERASRWLDRGEASFEADRRRATEVGRSGASLERELAWRAFEIERYRASAALARDDRAGALAAIDRAEQNQRRMSEAGGTDAARATQDDAFQRGVVAHLRAELDLRSGDPESALEHYRVEILAQPASLAMGLEDNVRTAWVAAHGDEGGLTEWLEGAEAEAGSVSEQSLATVRRLFPRFELVDLEGRTWTHRDLLGRVSLVNLWAVWCTPCRAELPELAALAAEWSDDPRIQVVTVNADRSSGSVASFVERERIGLPVLLGGKSIYSDWGIEASIPRTFVVDSHATIVAELVGFDSDTVAFRQELRKLVAAAAAGG